MLNTRVDNRYLLLEQIGAGGMGTVYRAEDRLTGNIVALKRVTAPTADLDFAARNDDLLPPDDSASLRLALAQEFQILASLRHPNIISVLDYGFADNYPFFTMDYLASSRTILDAGRDQPFSFKIDLLVQTLQAIHYLHRRGLIHRDLKPDNVLVTDDHQVKVLDFGLTKLVSDASRSAGSMTGTFAYMAPEVVLDGYASEQSDLYSLGVIAYQLLVGAHPFPASTLNQLFKSILYVPPNLTPLYNFDQPDLVLIINALMVKDPAERSADAHQVMVDLCAATGRPAEESAAIRESFLQAARFVGRDDEIERLSGALQNLGDGRGSLWLIGGESGVGKTRLLDELRARALVSGALVLRAGMVSGRSAPYHLWRALLPRLVLSSDLTDYEASVLKPLIPDIAVLLGRPVAEAPALEAQAENARLLQTIAALLRRHARPTVLILEDLHWASESIEILRDLSAELAHLPLLIIGSYRDDEKPDLPDQLDGAHLITLRRFTPQVTAQLSESMLGGINPSPALLDLIQRETEGNAFFLVETLRALAEEAGQLSAIESLELPQRVFAGGVQQVIQRRLDRVPASGRAALRLAAVAGRLVDLSLLRAAGVGDVDRWLDECASAAVLAVDQGRWQFAHDKLRDSVLDHLTDAERPLLHRQVAEAIEAIYPDDPTHAAQLVDHWRQAGDTDREIHYSLIASRQVLAVGDFAAARELSERALNLLPANRLHERMMLLGLVADAYYGISDYDRARDYYLASREMARARDDIAGQTAAYNGLGRCATRRSEYRAARELHEQAFILAQQIGDAHAGSIALRGIGSTYYFLDDPSSALDYHLKAYDLAATVNDLGEMADAMSGAGIFAQASGDPAARSYYERGLALSEEIGARHLIGISIYGIGVDDLIKGNYGSARDYLERALDAAHVSHELFAQAAVLQRLHWVYYCLGDFSRSLLAADACIDACRQMGSSQQLWEVLCQSVHTLLKLGEPEAARARLRDALPVNEPSRSDRLTAALLMAYAHLLVYRREPQRAAEFVAVILQQPFKDFNLLPLRIELLRRELRAQLTFAEIEAASARSTLTLDAAVAEVEAALSAP